MSLPAVGDRCFYDLRLGKFGMYFKFYGSMVQIADRELLKNPGVIAVFYRSVSQVF